MAAFGHFADARVPVAVLSQVEFEFRRPTTYKWAARVDTRSRRRRTQRAVQNRRVRGVDATLQRLQPVTLLDHFRYMAVTR